MLANAFAAFKGGENSKLLSDKGVAERYGGVGNQVRVVELRTVALCLLILMRIPGKSSVSRVHSPLYWIY
jgi:solute carrier family 35 protein E1